MLPTNGSGRRPWAPWPIGRRNPEDHLDAAIINFDSAHYGANDVLHSETIEILEPRGYLCREVFQTANHEGQIALTLYRFESCLMLFLPLGHALFQTRDAWLELCFMPSVSMSRAIPRRKPVI
jgi:hypothetical protein